MKNYLIINGPNLNLLGKRENQIYGNLSLKEIQAYTEEKLQQYELKIEWFQSNLEGEIITRIHSAMTENYDALIINPAGYSHTSVAIYDALKVVNIPVIEVHLSNVYAREDFRQRMLTAKAASKIMSGLGRDSYHIAVLSDVLT